MSSDALPNGTRPPGIDRRESYAATATLASASCPTRAGADNSGYFGGIVPWSDGSGTVRKAESAAARGPC